MLILLCSGNFSSPVHAAASSNGITQPYCASGDDPCITFSIPSDHTQIIYDWTTAGHRHDTIQVGYSVLSRTSTGKSIVLNDWRQHETLIGYGEDSIPVIYENAVYYITAQTCDKDWLGDHTCYAWTPFAKIWTGPHEVYGYILDEYEKTGLTNGPLGTPTSDEAPAGKSKGRYNFF